MIILFNITEEKAIVNPMIKFIEDKMKVLNCP